MMTDIRLDPYEIATVQLFLTFKDEMCSGSTSYLHSTLWNKLRRYWCLVSERWNDLFWVLWLESSTTGIWELEFSDSQFSILSTILYCASAERVKMTTTIMVLKVWSKISELCFFRGGKKPVSMLRWLITGTLVWEKCASSNYLYLPAKR